MTYLATLPLAQLNTFSESCSLAISAGPGAFKLGLWARLFDSLVF